MTACMATVQATRYQENVWFTLHAPCSFATNPSGEPGQCDSCVQEVLLSFVFASSIHAAAPSIQMPFKSNLVALIVYGHVYLCRKSTSEHSSSSQSHTRCDAKASCNGLASCKAHVMTPPPSQLEIAKCRHLRITEPTRTCPGRAASKLPWPHAPKLLKRSCTSSVERGTESWVESFGLMGFGLMGVGIGSWRLGMDELGWAGLEMQRWGQVWCLRIYGSGIVRARPWLEAFGLLMSTSWGSAFVGQSLEKASIQSTVHCTLRLSANSHVQQEIWEHPVGSWIRDPVWLSQHMSRGFGLGT